MLTNMVVLSAILWFRKSDQWGWHESHVKKWGHGLGETYPKTTHVQCIPQNEKKAHAGIFRKKGIGMGVGVLMPRPLWLSSILPGYTIDITEKKLENDRVCSRNFLSGHPAKDWDRMDIDLIPTQNLGHSKRQQANQVNVERVQ